MRKMSALFLFITMVLCVILMSTFLVWYRQYAQPAPLSTPFNMFAWSLVLSVEWVLLMRAYNLFREDRQ